MPTVKRRINITAPKELEDALFRLAERDNASVAGKATELLRRAVEIEEDAVWDSLAKKRDTKKAKFIPHSRAWA